MKLFLSFLIIMTIAPSFSETFESDHTYILKTRNIHCEYKSGDTNIPQVKCMQKIVFKNNNFAEITIDKNIIYGSYKKNGISFVFTPENAIIEKIIFTTDKNGNLKDQFRNTWFHEKSLATAFDCYFYARTTNRDSSGWEVSTRDYRLQVNEKGAVYVEKGCVHCSFKKNKFWVVPRDKLPDLSGKEIGVYSYQLCRDKNQHLVLIDPSSGLDCTDVEQNMTGNKKVLDEHYFRTYVPSKNGHYGRITCRKVN